MSCSAAEVNGMERGGQEVLKEISFIISFASPESTLPDMIKKGGVYPILFGEWGRSSYYTALMDIINFYRSLHLFNNKGQQNSSQHTIKKT